MAESKILEGICNLKINPYAISNAGVALSITLYKDYVPEIIICSTYRLQIRKTFQPLLVLLQHQVLLAFPL